jgi:hypothetical protein
MFLGTYDDPETLNVFIVLEYFPLGSLDKLLALEEKNITVQMLQDM